MQPCVWVRPGVAESKSISMFARWSLPMRTCIVGRFHPAFPEIKGRPYPQSCPSKQAANLDQVVTQVLDRTSSKTRAVAKRLPRVLYVVVMDPAQKFGSMEEQMLFLSREF